MRPSSSPKYIEGGSPQEPWRQVTFTKSYAPSQRWPASQSVVPLLTCTEVVEGRASLGMSR